MQYNLRHKAAINPSITTIEADTYEQACIKSLEFLGYKVDGPLVQDEPLNRPVAVD